MKGSMQMSRRSLAVACAVIGLTAVIATWSIPVAGQNARPATAKPYSPPKMPWGEPDISGNFTNVYEQATPLERPDEFAGVKRDDIKGQQLSDLLAKRRDAGRQRMAEELLARFIKVKGRGPASPEEIKAFLAKELAARRRIQKGNRS